MEDTNNPGLVEGHKALRHVMKFIWISVGIGVLSSMVGIGIAVWTLARISTLTPEVGLAPMMFPMFLAVLMVVGGITLSVFVALHIEKGHNWARWVYLGFAIWGVYNGVKAIGVLSTDGWMLGLLQFLLFTGGAVLQVYICWLLFRSPARLVFLKDKLTRMENDLKALRGETSETSAGPAST